MGLGRNDLPGSGDRGPSGELDPSTTTEPRRFPLAAQPEVMRAAEKDDQYASFVYDACRDAFRHLFGILIFVTSFGFLYFLRRVITSCKRKLFNFGRHESCSSLSERG